MTFGPTGEVLDGGATALEPVTRRLNAQISDLLREWDALLLEDKLPLQNS
jgi:hypothetical protein